MLSILVSICVVVFVIGRQLLGEPLRGKRLLLLPAILAVVGAVTLFSHSNHPTVGSVLIIVLGAVISAAIGLAQGRMMRISSRNGYLWGQMPLRSLWLWLGLIVSHATLELIAAVAGAHLAAGSKWVLLALGVNRLAQAVVIAPRALAAGIPFAPEKDGSVFLSEIFGDAGRPRNAGTPPATRPDRHTPASDLAPLARETLAEARAMLRRHAQQ